MYIANHYETYKSKQSQSSPFNSSSMSHTGLGDRCLLGAPPLLDGAPLLLCLGSVEGVSSTYSSSSISRGGLLTIALLGTGGGGMSAADPK